jgi:hypothetical protein
MPDQTCGDPKLPASGGAPDVGSATGILGAAHGGTGADLSNGAAAKVLATPPGASGPLALRSLAPEHLPAISPSPAGTATFATIEVDQYGRVISLSSGAGGNLLTQSLSPPGGSVAFSAELYLGPDGAKYSYSPGGPGYLPGCVFASTLKRFTFRTVASTVDLTVRLRTSAGTEIYSKVLLTGQTLIDEAVNIALAHDVLVQLSVEPASGTPAIDAFAFGWVRQITPAS